MNGVKEKFKNDDVRLLFSECDVIVIMETHFNVRHKCPEGFELVEKSVPMCTKTGRGGVAVYAKKVLQLSFVVYHDVCPDAVVLKLRNTNIVIVAPYIVPDNSKYKINKIFTILDFIMKNFTKDRVYLIGDLNARCATPVDTGRYQYDRNPDCVINSSGRKLMSFCSDNDLLVVNGLRYRNRRFDTNFTYHRGNLKSQNDWCITNDIDSVRSFEILKKMIVSDHNPCVVTIGYRPTISLELLGKCASGNFSYESHDKSSKLKKKIYLNNICVTTAMIKDFNQLAEKLSEWIHAGESVNTIAVKTNENIYEICE